jgi:hypothetical protein
MGYDDTTFQEAIRGQSEEAFFSKFRMFTPAERTATGTSWTVHTMFSIQEQKADSDSVRYGFDEFVGVPSKMVVPADGPLQVLKAGKRRRVEIIMQAAAHSHCLSRCKRVLFGAPRVADRYPSNIDERRKSYQAMMQAAKELKVTTAQAQTIFPAQRCLGRPAPKWIGLQISQQIGSNQGQIKVQAEWPAEAVPVTGLAKVALLAFCFEVEFEGYASFVSCLL